MKYCAKSRSLTDCIDQHAGCKPGARRLSASMCGHCITGGMYSELNPLVCLYVEQVLSITNA